MRKLAVILFGFGLNWSLQTWAQDPVEIKSKPVSTKIDKVDSHHHLGLGLSGFVFLDNLSDQFSNTLGPVVSYEFNYAVLSTFKAGLALRAAYFNAKKDGYDNVNYLISPVLKLHYTALPEIIGVMVGFDTEFWTQSRTFIQRQVLHQDTLYGLLVGFFMESDFGKWGHLEYLLGYHMQQFSFATSFLEIGVQYVWDS